MSSTVDSDPRILKLAIRVEGMQDILDDLIEALELHNANFKDISNALEATHKWLTIHEKRMVKLEKKK